MGPLAAESPARFEQASSCSSLVHARGPRACTFPNSALLLSPRSRQPLRRRWPCLMTGRGSALSQLKPPSAESHNHFKERGHERLRCKRATSELACSDNKSPLCRPLSTLQAAVAEEVALSDDCDWERFETVGTIGCGIAQTFQNAPFWSTSAQHATPMLLIPTWYNLLLSSLNASGSRCGGGSLVRRLGVGAR